MPRLSRLRLSRLEVGVVAVTAAVVASLLFQWPHWTEYVAQSCAACGNRRTIVREYRWYRQADEIERWDTDYPVPPGHTHDWWQYGFGKSSPTGSYAGSNSVIYRDGSMTWNPPQPSTPATD